MTDDDAPTDETEDQTLVREAKKRFKKSSDWESLARTRFIEDIKFREGDSDNLFQWPAAVRTARGWGTGDERPCLTINKAKQHCLQITNDARQNKTSVKVRPVGNGATYDAAQVIEGIVRHIEYVSDAQAIYTQAIGFQVGGGIGYWRLVTDYIDDTSFDQDIYLRPIKDPLTVFLDPDITQFDGSDARYGFIFEDIARDEFETLYPKVTLPPATATLGNGEDWIGEDKVRVAEYFWVEEVRDRLIVFVDPETGKKTPVKESEMKGAKGALKKAFAEQIDNPYTKKRDIVARNVKWAKIAGDEVLERKDWAGKYVPIVRVIGEETVIDGQLDRKGHVRALKDPQRMYNYNASAAVEYGALQGKQPWVAPAKAIEEYQTYWDSANQANYSVLPWNHMDDDGNPIPPPMRPNPPTGAPLYQEGMQNAATDMMLVSGQYQSMMGEPSNERSGKAIQARQRQGENATYHYIDNFAVAVRFCGKMIIDLIPKIYDTPRVVKIMGEDGADSDVKIDPAAQKAYEERKAETEGAAAQVIMNPNVGLYEVMSDVGPDYATRRQEAFNALTQIASQNPELMSIIGDLVMMAADFPLADEAAERLKRMVPAQALGEGPNPQVMQLQGALDASQKLSAAMSAKLVELQSKLSEKDAQKAVNIYKAITDRMDTLMKYSNIPAVELMRFQHDLAKQEHAGDIAMADKFLDSHLAAQTESMDEGADA